MQLDPVEAEALRVDRGPNERGNNLVDVVDRRCLTLFGAVGAQTGRAEHRRVRMRCGAFAAGDSEVPQLRDDPAADCVHRFDDALPTGKRRLTVEPGHAVA
jgi:hypothetical protein